MRAGIRAPGSRIIVGAFLAGEGASFEEDPKRRALQSIAVAGIALGLIAQVFFTAQHGPSPLFLAVPVALGVALVLDDLERSGVGRRFVAVAALLGVETILGAFLAGALFSFVFREKRAQLTQ